MGDTCLGGSAGTSGVKEDFSSGRSPLRFLIKGSSYIYAELRSLTAAFP